MKTVLLLVMLAACKFATKMDASPSAGSATSGDCAPIITKVIDDAARAGVANGAGSAAPNAEVEKMGNDMIVSLAGVKAATIKACVDDKWSSDALACLKAKGSVTDCDAKLTDQQRSHRDELASKAAKAATADAPAACIKYAKYEIECGGADQSARPTILDFCTRARAGNPDPTYQLIKLESECAESSADCASYKSCVDAKKKTTAPQ